jgi:hypothetical protein
MSKPLTRQLPRQLQPDDPLAKAQHLRIIALDAPLNAERVVRCHRADTLDFIRRDGDAQARPADEQRAVGFALGDETRGGGGACWVGCLVVFGVGAYVDDGLDAGIVLEVGFDGVLITEAGLLWKMSVLFPSTATHFGYELVRHLHRIP